MIKYINFDFDNTLLDYQKAKQKAMQSVTIHLESKRIKENAEKFRTEYNELELILFRKFLDKKISIKEYRFLRFYKLLKGLVLMDDENLANKCNHIYMKIANHDIGLFSDVIPCFSLSNSRSILSAILTN